ncbi:MAG: methylated-DNA--[protein]-cysteine S-methyltransferase [Cryobacterium sp.]|nr:methylated-DNA--[protein]-cysteine S-methyltransferase [Cryobacterium sp.]MCC7128194.1 methylated-DNA--[protein]-cysteine S-methyltransferase [Microbacteriaceae bacterium]MCO5294081.1 methylated-DNA--[protein]-cysteine S-methyltransferase [Homoserinimonas sp.]MBX3090691.1 methylated-DNA--[protein]-cysteine S-methyltransferase [Cryobacterium sp.]MBX3116016.1 methylated-DNA--[protein]-cysteine S-methyltransferase [Cryobacterium sp.]
METLENLEELRQVDESTLARLHQRLERESEEEGLLAVAFREIDSPIGKLLIASTSRGLVRLAFQNEKREEVLDELSRKLSPAILESPSKLDKESRELDEYFRGERRDFDLPLDLSLSTGFRRRVLGEMARIPYGATSTYSRLAVAAGSPNATRAVGTACATNPIPIVLPCHRVLRTDGSLGGYRGGLEAKSTLLELESR